jgi:hypothetical protein
VVLLFNKLCLFEFKGLFSVTLNKKHYQAAMQVREEAKAEGLEDIGIHVGAANIYKKSFTFP